MAAQHRSPSGRVAHAAWRVLASVVATAAAGLVLLHVWIFWEQLASGRLLDPVLTLKWLGAGGLCAALLLLRRTGVPLLWGRKAFVVWLLVALLHVGAGAPAADAAADPHHDTATVFVLPALLAPLAAAGLCLVLLWRAARVAAALCVRGFHGLEPAFVAIAATDVRQVPPRAPPSAR